MATKKWIDLPVNPGGPIFLYDAYGNPISSTGTSLNVNVTGGSVTISEGNPFHYKGSQVDAVANTNYVLITQAFAANRKLRRAVTTYNGVGLSTVKLNSTIIATFLNTNANGTQAYDFLPYYSLVPGDVLTLDFIARQGSPSNNVEAYFHVSD